MSDELVEFLRVRIDEDEAKARACLPGPWLTGTQAGFAESEHVDLGRLIFGRSSGSQDGSQNFKPIRPDLDRWGQVANLEMAWKHEAHIAHITTHDPARVLREVEAKRRILDLHERSDCRGHDGPWIPHGTACTYECTECGHDYPCDTIKLLSQSHDGRGGWREEWRP